MTPPATVVGLGQRLAGDDGVGLAVLDELARRRLPAGVALVCLDRPMDLIELVRDRAGVVLVNAVRARPPGVVLELPVDALSRSGVEPPASSHGMGAAEALGLARALMPGVARRVRVVAVTIARAAPGRIGLSPEVEAAVPGAADRVLAVLARR